jgi:protein phosphatase
VRSFALYGDTTGETDEYGLPVRYPWANEYRGSAMVLYGHTPTPELRWVNNTLCLDTGCVFGGRLTALRYPEKATLSVPAERVWYEPVKPLTATGNTASAAVGTTERHPDQLELTDVIGKRVVETAYHGNVTVREDNAAGALEVMSRFALHPRWLPYLPPTMAPVATSSRPDLLEHPLEAFAAYRAAGVDTVICEEKHMGSRAVVVLCRTDQVAADEFGAPPGESGAVYTRTGRPFFDRPTTEALLGRLRAAVETSGLWAELDMSWLVLDCEILPWSLRAEGLLREQYAAVGSAATSGLDAALAALEQAETAGLDVCELRSRTAARAGNAERFVSVYRRYCWPTNGLDGVEVAPFQLLATKGRTYADREHLWHLGLAEKMARAAPTLVRPTRHLVVRCDDEASVAEGVAWWESLTASGGEGMVVKPAANLTRGGRGLVQPGIKVRGREYLRIIYGPAYTEPANLERLKDRNLGHKRSLALREYALCLESLDRLARDEPLWRVHEAVFAVLALESEPVDPRL